MKLSVPTFKRLLLYRFILLNSLLIGLLVYLTSQGFTGRIFSNDLSFISYGIAALFVVGWVWVLKSVIKLSWMLDDAKLNGYPPQQIWDENKAAVKIEWLESIAEWLVGFGLLGTVVGFSIALSGVDQGSLMQAEGAQSSVGILMTGMRVALNTTLLGAGLAIWHQINLRMFRTAFVSYWTECRRQGEYHL